MVVWKVLVIMSRNSCSITSQVIPFESEEAASKAIAILTEQSNKKCKNTVWGTEIQAIPLY